MRACSTQHTQLISPHTDVPALQHVCHLVVRALSFGAVPVLVTEKVRHSAPSRFRSRLNESVCAQLGTTLSTPLDVVRHFATDRDEADAVSQKERRAWSRIVVNRNDTTVVEMQISGPAFVTWPMSIAGASLADVETTLDVLQQRHLHWDTIMLHVAVALTRMAADVVCHPESHPVPCAAVASFVRSHSPGSWPAEVAVSALQQSVIASRKLVH